MNTEDINKLISDLDAISALVSAATPKMEEMRTYFKFQSRDLDSSSEDAICAWESVKEIQNVVTSMKEIRDLEEEDE